MDTLKRVIKHFLDLRTLTHLQRSKDVRIYPDVSGWKNVTFHGKNVIGRGVNFSNSVEIGCGTTIGPYNVIAGPVTIGSFCQLGQFVGIYGQDHPITYLSTYVNKNLFDGRLREHITSAKVEVGSGVWIGHGAVLLKGIRVGDGAIIGANAVVTSDVPPYMIAVGNPAKCIKARFSQDVIEVLKSFPWHLLTPKELQELEPVFHIDFEKDPQKALDELKAIVARFAFRFPSFEKNDN